MTKYRCTRCGNATRGGWTDGGSIVCPDCAWGHDPEDGEPLPPDPDAAPAPGRLDGQTVAEVRERMDQWNRTR